MDTLRSRFQRLGLVNNRAIFEYAVQGIKPSLFYSFSEVAGVHPTDLAGWIHIHPRTLSSYKTKRKKLQPVESEHLLQLIALYLKGEEIFGDVDQLNQWLEKPFWKSTTRPIDWLVTPGGVQLISDELDRLAHGYAA